MYYAAIQNRVYYECHSLLEAVDIICIKATSVFNLTYAPSLHSSWLFVQKAVYCISIAYDACLVEVTSLINGRNLISPHSHFEQC